MFQSTPPRRGDRGWRREWARRPSFNPRPREGATSVLCHVVPPDKVSIHAPAKGRPANDLIIEVSYQVSIHAPAKGRLECQRLPCRMGRFNPRPREGATGLRGSWFHLIKVSIHAPAKGRPLTSRLINLVREFQSTPPRRGDTLRCLVRGRSPRFQSTPPRRGDFGLWVWVMAGGGFNPRPREGATGRHRPVPSPRVVSIHAPAKGRPVP